MLAFTTLAALIIGVVMPIVWLLGSSNPFTPAGYVGYLPMGVPMTGTFETTAPRGPTVAER